MQKVAWLAVALGGCVFHVPSDFQGSDGTDYSLYFDPSSVHPGESAVGTITDDYGAADFREVWDVRSVGDFAVVEWSGHEDRLDLVIEVAPEAAGDQAIAVELNSGTYYASFLAQ